MDIVKYYLEELLVNPRLTLMGSVEDEQTESQNGGDELVIEFPSLAIQCFSLVLTVHNEDQDMLNYLLNKFGEGGMIVSYPLWNSEQLSFILRGAVIEQWKEGITTILKGNLA